MKRIVILLLSVLALALTPTIGLSQGLFGGIPGLPSFGGAFGGTGACGPKACAPAGPTFYVGWMEDRDGTSFTGNVDNLPLDTVFSVQHKYPNKGTWLGLSQCVPLKDSVAFIASGWYLIPCNVNSHEIYNAGAAERTWDSDTQWWFVDGLFSIGGAGGLSLLAGLRYDYFTTRFKNPFDVNGLGGLALLTDTADVGTENWIPLFGTQMSYAGSFGNLVVRAVGVPTLVGCAWYKQTLGAVPTRIEAKGNYNGGYFLEFFGEYSKSFGPGSVGVFGRWNMAEGKAKMSTDLVGVVSRDINLTLHRNSWTLGGCFSLAFNMPGIPGM